MARVRHAGGAGAAFAAGGASVGLSWTVGTAALVIMPATVFYQSKNPAGYCPDHSTGVACPIGLGVRS